MNDDRFPFEVRDDQMERMSVLNRVWCADNIGPKNIKWIYDGGSIRFKYKEDMVFFLLSRG